MHLGSLVMGGPCSTAVVAPFTMLELEPEPRLPFSLDFSFVGVAGHLHGIEDGLGRLKLMFGSGNDSPSVPVSTSSPSPARPELFLYFGL